MKVSFDYDERFAMQVGLNALLRYNKAMFISVDNDKIDIPTVEEYFKAEPNSAKERELAKTLVIAAKDTFMTHPDIPNRNKVDCALRGAKEFHSALEGAKNDYLRESGYFGVGLQAEEKYNKRQKGNVVVRNATIVYMAKKRLKNIPTRILKKEGIKTIAGFISGALAHMGFQGAAGSTLVTIATSLGIPVAVLSTVGAATAGAIAVIAVDIAYTLIPDETKKKIKEKAYYLMEKAGNQIEASYKRLADTAVGKEVINAYNSHVVPVIEKGISKMEEYYDKARTVAKSFYTKVKSFFA